MEKILEITNALCAPMRYVPPESGFLKKTGIDHYISELLLKTHFLHKIIELILFKRYRKIAQPTSK